MKERIKIKNAEQLRDYVEELLKDDFFCDVSRAGDDVIMRFSDKKITVKIK